MSDLSRSPVIPELGTGIALEEIASSASACARVDLTGVKGGALAVVLARLSLVFNGRHVVVTEDFARARDLSRDLSCHLRSDGDNDILLFPQYDLGPYDELVSDRRSTMNRAGALFKMIMDKRWQFLVISADALLRRVVPRGALRGCLRSGSYRRYDPSGFADRCARNRRL